MPDIPAYGDFLPSEFVARLLEESVSVPEVPGLRVSPQVKEEFAHLVPAEALSLVVEVYQRIKGALREVLNQRALDRVFVDDFGRNAVARNRDREFYSTDYETVLGAKDALGRVVVGSMQEPEARSRCLVPEFLSGAQVTLFGPPESKKMSVNAMNAIHRQIPNEPALVADLVQASGDVPRWGADSEDSQTPIMRLLLSGCENLRDCFLGTLRVQEGDGKVYALSDEKRAVPVKRIPGLALPEGNCLLDGNPLPLHVFDLILHLFHNHENPKALVFYIPKLENEEEAAYFKLLVTEAERVIQARDQSFRQGTVKLFVVFENPRAIFRIPQIAEALHPHFVGGSLGWHDFLASTARLFKSDPNYRIPAKADPNIVINHIAESHHLLVRALDPIGGIGIGGMYGTLYEDGNPTSFEASVVGYIKDVVVQLRRGLDGFWVAHPNFVRIGVALVEAFRRSTTDQRDTSLRDLICALVPNQAEQAFLLEFVSREDSDGLDESHPLYARSVLAADVAESVAFRNSDVVEVRYNIFQTLQYLAAWLSGKGCVALPAQVKNVAGESVFVRVMDDLATTERSRWELWAEVFHGRVSVELFDEILEEEYAFICAGKATHQKRVEVRFEAEFAPWYPISRKILRLLVVSSHPVEFVSELLLPFTF